MNIYEHTYIHIQTVSKQSANSQQTVSDIFVSHTAQKLPRTHTHIERMAQREWVRVRERGREGGGGGER